MRFFLCTFFLVVCRLLFIFAGMKREVYESQKAFAGEKKPSMQRRCVGHDYTERMMYMVTMVVEGRRPLFGTVVGRNDAPAGSEDAARVELTELGRRVEACWYEIAVRHPKIKVLALQMMPDHFHGILFVTERLELPLGKVLLGFKQGCNKAYREVQSVAVTATNRTGRAEEGPAGGGPQPRAAFRARLQRQAAVARGAATKMAGLSP
jgi:hypothetical protein